MMSLMKRRKMTMRREPQMMIITVPPFMVDRWLLLPTLTFLQQVFILDNFITKKRTILPK